MLFNREPIVVRSLPYHSTDSSMLYPYIRPVFVKVHKLIWGNSNISPNVITLIGFLSTIAIISLSLFGCAGFSSKLMIPGFSPMIAILITTYFAADCIDGMQGKKTGMYEHPLCELFDHGMDVLAVIGISLATLHLLNASNFAAALLLFNALSMTLLSHNEQVVTGTFNFPPGPANVTNLVISAVLLFVTCTFLPFIPSIHIPFTSINLATAVAVSGFFTTSYYFYEAYTRIPRAITLSLPGIAAFGFSLTTWYLTQPHFLNRFTLMGCIAPLTCYLWAVILGKFTTAKPSAQSVIIPLCCALINLRLHSTVTGFFFTSGLIAFAPLYYCSLVRSVTKALNMKHWWEVQLDSEVDKQTEKNKNNKNGIEKKMSREELQKMKEEERRIEAEEREKRMIQDEKEGFTTVGKNGKIIHPKKSLQEEKKNEDEKSTEKQQLTNEEESEQKGGNLKEETSEKKEGENQQQQQKEEEEDTKEESKKADVKEGEIGDLKGDEKQETAEQKADKEALVKARPAQLKTTKQQQTQPSQPSPATTNRHQTIGTNHTSSHVMPKLKTVESHDNGQAPEGDDSRNINTAVKKTNRVRGWEVEPNRA